MSSILLSGPAAEPLTLDEAKAYLRVEHSDDDLTIAALIAGSRIHVERQTRRALITQSWRIVRDGWPADGRISLSPSPLQDIVAARVYELDGSTRDIGLQAFVIDKGAAAIAFAPWALPQPGRIAAGIEIDIRVGYGDAAADVPEPLRQAIRLLVAHWYENRSAPAGALPIGATPAGVAALIAPYRVASL
ncbi:MAG TPA: head-tail connector protein [Xanthobacteraceae bacterium]|nr:head-tail connector protein [Xanthobacteraceae bacterium]